MTLNEFIYTEHVEGLAWRACPVPGRSGLIFTHLRQKKDSSNGNKKLSDSGLLPAWKGQFAEPPFWT